VSATIDIGPLADGQLVKPIVNHVPDYQPPAAVTTAQ